jgi:hypothetical protein
MGLERELATYAFEDVEQVALGLVRYFLGVETWLRRHVVWLRAWRLRT